MKKIRQKNSTKKKPKKKLFMEKRKRDSTDDTDAIDDRHEDKRIEDSRTRMRTGTKHDPAQPEDFECVSNHVHGVIVEQAVAKGRSRFEDRVGDMKGFPPSFIKRIQDAIFELFQCGDADADKYLKACNTDELLTYSKYYIASVHDDWMLLGDWYCLMLLTRELALRNSGKITNLLDSAKHIAQGHRVKEQMFSFCFPPADLVSTAVQPCLRQPD